MLDPDHRRDGSESHLHRTAWVATVERDAGENRSHRARDSRAGHCVWRRLRRRGERRAGRRSGVLPARLRRPADRWEGRRRAQHDPAGRRAARSRALGARRRAVGPRIVVYLGAGFSRRSRMRSTRRKARRWTSSRWTASVSTDRVAGPTRTCGSGSRPLPPHRRPDRRGAGPPARGARVRSPSRDARRRVPRGTRTLQQPRARHRSRRLRLPRRPLRPAPGLGERGSRRRPSPRRAYDGRRFPCTSDRRLHRLHRAARLPLAWPRRSPARPGCVRQSSTFSRV